MRSRYYLDSIWISSGALQILSGEYQILPEFFIFWLLSGEHQKANMSVKLNINLCISAADVEDKMPDSKTKEVCITEQTQYYYENEESTFFGSVKCYNCSR